ISGIDHGIMPSFVKMETYIAKGKGFIFLKITFGMHLGLNASYFSGKMQRNSEKTKDLSSDGNLPWIIQTIILCGALVQFSAPLYGRAFMTARYSGLSESFPPAEDRSLSDSIPTAEVGALERSQGCWTRRALIFLQPRGHDEI
ncbi:MAG: hypothetical protein IKM07_02835, partial [Clostridia bacterium]|nr:hypothetical protein [Clostridia bacterium]